MATRLCAGLSSSVCGLRRRPSRGRQVRCQRWTRWPRRTPIRSRPIGCSASPCATSSGLSPFTPTSLRMRRTGRYSSSPRVWRTSSSGMQPHCGVSAARLGDGRRMAPAAGHHLPKPRGAARPRCQSRGCDGDTAWCAGRGGSRARRSRECRGAAQRCDRGRGAAPGGNAPGADRRPCVPAAAGAFDLLRAALVDLEGAYDMYLRAAEGRAGEDAMLDTQRWAESAMRRSGIIRRRLTALGKVAQP